MKHVLPVSAVLLLALAWFLTGCGGSADTQSQGRITGFVHESGLAARSREAGSPITVSIEGTRLSTTAASDGSFQLNRVPPGMYTLVARSSRYAGAFVVQVVGNEATDVGDVVLQEAGEISGLVTSATTNLPIADAQVTIMDIVTENPTEMQPLPARMTYTDAEGRYAEPGLPAGEYLVTIDKRGYEAVSLQLTVTASTVTNGDASLQPVSTAGTGTMSGTVYLQTENEAPQPLEGVLVRLVPPNAVSPLDPMPMTALDGNGVVVVPGEDGGVVPPTEPIPEYYTFTGPDGRYSLEYVPAGDYLAVAVRPGLDPAEQAVTITADSTLTRDFTLQMHPLQFGTITGTVTAAEGGAPITGAVVTAVMRPVPVTTSTDPTGADVGSPGMGVIISPGGCFMAAITDDAGHYRLLVPPAVTAIFVYAEGYLPREAPVSVVVDGSVTADVQLERMPAGVDVTLSGRVTREVGPAVVPEEGATVNVCTITPPGTEMPVRLYTAQTNAEGNYSLVLPAGEYQAFAQKDVYLSPMTRLSLTQDTTADFVLSPGGGTEPPVPMTTTHGKRGRGR